MFQDKLHAAESNFDVLFLFPQVKLPDERLCCRSGSVVKESHLDMN